ncbi:TLC domain-containing protein 2-like [Asterias amurensis]|uniref:TLC domain-containing protein 2-like n=1 Tax=Asterias amurensis TaxID=7602 RepID=UPI003AB3C1BF
MERGVRLAMGSFADSDGMPTSMFHARMIYTIVGSTIAFQCLNITLNFTPAPQKYYSEPRFRWRNILTSFTHAMISGFCSIFCLYSSPELLDDLIHNVTPMGEVLVAISVGYFIYDVIDILLYRSVTNTWPLLIHHIVILFCFGISLYLRSFIVYSLVSLAAEINSVFLHFRQILLIVNTPKHSAIYRANSAINIVSFLFFRFGTLVWMFYWLQSHYREVPFLLYCVATVGLITMVIINMVLYKRLLISDFIARGDKLKKEKSVLEK